MLKTNCKAALQSTQFLSLSSNTLFSYLLSPPLPFIMYLTCFPDLLFHVSDIPIMTQSLFLLILKTLRIYSLNNFPTYHTAVLTIVIMLYMISRVLTNLATANLCFDHLPLFLLPTSPLWLKSYSCCLVSV